MKYRYTITSLVLALAFSCPTHGQERPAKPTIPAGAVKSIQLQQLKPARIEEKKCLPLDTRNVENILRDKIGRTLNIYMDKDYGHVEIMGQRQNVHFDTFKVNKPARDWLYSLNDVSSTVTRVRASGTSFVLTTHFESDGNEIKGTCPGCRMGKDNRAPDINWKDPAIRIWLKPVAYKDAFTLEVQLVELMGKFDLNGPMDTFFPSISAFFKNAIVNKIKGTIKEILNRNDIEDMIAQAFKPEVERLGLSSVRSIDANRDRIYLCNYPADHADQQSAKP
ncbi:MAG: hypothetical protein Kow0020_02650 [Wenzhouxiangellaceae bacterium]